MDLDTARPAPAVRAPRRRSPGWIPNQHGAWAMLVIPLLLGIIASGPAWVHLPLALVWVVGYFAFYAAGLWLKARLKKKYLPPVRAYAIMLIVPAVAVLVLQPELVVWGLVFSPLVAISLWCSYQRRDRSILNDSVTVLAACLMLPVAYSAGLPPTPLPDVVGWLAQPGPVGWAAVWAATVLVLGYFFGTVLYVKSLIRRRGDRRFLAVSVGYHAVAGVVLAALVAAVGQAWWPTAAMFALLTARAWWVPRTAAKPVQFGLGEFGASVLVAVAAVGVLDVLG